MGDQKEARDNERTSWATERQSWERPDSDGGSGVWDGEPAGHIFVIIRPHGDDTEDNADPLGDRSRNRSASPMASGETGERSDIGGESGRWESAFITAGTPEAAIAAGVERAVRQFIEVAQREHSGRSRDGTSGAPGRPEESGNRRTEDELDIVNELIDRINWLELEVKSLGSRVAGYAATWQVGQLQQRDADQSSHIADLERRVSELERKLT